MTEGVTVTVSIDLKPKEADAFCRDQIPHLLKQTRNFSGVRSARVVRQADDPTKVLFIDIFDTVEASVRYFEWWDGTGDLGRLAKLLSEPPRIEMWPLVIDSA